MRACVEGGLGGLVDGAAKQLFRGKTGARFHSSRCTGRNLVHIFTFQLFKNSKGYPKEGAEMREGTDFRFQIFKNSKGYPKEGGEMCKG